MSTKEELQTRLLNLGIEFPPGASEQDLKNILLSYWYQQGGVRTRQQRIFQNPNITQRQTFDTPQFQTIGLPSRGGTIFDEEKTTLDRSVTKFNLMMLSLLMFIKHKLKQQQQTDNICFINLQDNNAIMGYRIDSDSLIATSPLAYAIKSCLENINIRFICIGLSIFDIGKYSGHANILIIDKNNKTLERFEPNGSYFVKRRISEQEKMDNQIMEFVKKVLELSDIDAVHKAGWKYFKPTTFCPQLGWHSQQQLQMWNADTISKELSQFIDDTGNPDTEGYCMAWSLYYVYLRLLNQHLTRTEVLNESQTQLSKIHLTQFISQFAKFVVEITRFSSDASGILTEETAIELMDVFLNSEYPLQQVDFAPAPASDDDEPLTGSLFGTAGDTNIDDVDDVDDVDDAADALLQLSAAGAAAKNSYMPRAPVTGGSARVPATGGSIFNNQYVSAPARAAARAARAAADAARAAGGSIFYPAPVPAAAPAAAPAAGGSIFDNQHARAAAPAPATGGSIFAKKTYMPRAPVTGGSARVPATGGSIFANQYARAAAPAAAPAAGGYIFNPNPFARAAAPAAAPAAGGSIFDNQHALLLLRVVLFLITNMLLLLLLLRVVIFLIVFNG
jgi:hypothetical protein